MFLGTSVSLAVLVSAFNIPYFIYFEFFAKVLQVRAAVRPENFYGEIEMNNVGTLGSELIVFITIRLGCLAKLNANSPVWIHGDKKHGNAQSSAFLSTY